jgi:glycosyltransferase 2 family protein
LIFSSYFFRCLRWKGFLRPLKVAGLENLVRSTVLGFSAVALLGRPGELVRPLLISRKEKMTLSSQLAAWTLERIFDGLTIGIMLGAVLSFTSPGSAEYSGGANATRFLTGIKTGGMILCAGAVGMAVALSQFPRIAPFLVKLLSAVARLLPLRRRSGFETFMGKILASFAQGFRSIATVPRFAASMAYSALVWAPVVLAYWVVAWGFGPPMSALGLRDLVVLLSASVVGSLAQLPGVGGGPQLVTLFSLTQFFGIPLEVATTAAILLWAICYMAVLIPGLPLAAHEGLNWRRLRALVKAAEPNGTPEGSSNLAPNGP